MSGLDPPPDDFFAAELEHNLRDLQDVDMCIYTTVTGLITKIQEYQSNDLEHLVNVVMPQLHPSGAYQYVEDKLPKPENPQPLQVLRETIELAYSKKKKAFVEKMITQKKLSNDHVINWNQMDFLQTTDTQSHLLLLSIEGTVKFIDREVTVTTEVRTNGHKEGKFNLFYYYVTRNSGTRPSWNLGSTFKSIDYTNVNEFKFTFFEEFEEFPIIMALQLSSFGKAFIPYGLYVIKNKIRVFKLHYENIYKTLFVVKKKIEL
ncbi:unnamed protein product [Bursaphelenchus okinawaensis]|uniref:Uncharacterized protein n=1 Tax=Bursaphelenchus okinawaensis TaxID=465554 RepID=A0A811JSU2_9BILA|nr:unnamed protein product [Bursaphelenchus okinawaensis]CAG9081469.1 unnamed protein product [Bursaphelenchus okinawaensis]